METIEFVYQIKFKNVNEPVVVISSGEIADMQGVHIEWWRLIGKVIRKHDIY